MKMEVRRVKNASIKSRTWHAMAGNGVASMIAKSNRFLEVLDLDDDASKTLSMEGLVR